MAREGFVIYHELLNWLEPYADTERGRILTAMLKYSMTGESPELSGNERFVWPAIRDKIDRDKEAYASKCKQLATNASKGHQKVAEGYNSSPTETGTGTEDETEAVTETATGTKAVTKGKSSSKSTLHTYGQYGWIKLTDVEYQRLQKDLGTEELERCIAYVDESAQGTHNKNKWADWNLIIRKCARLGWGLQNERRAGNGSGGILDKSTEQAPKYTIICD